MQELQPDLFPSHTERLRGRDAKPVLNYRELGEGSVEARFRLDLVAAVVPAAGQEGAYAHSMSELNRRLGEMFATMALGQKLHIDYLLDSAPGGSPVQWHIHGLARACDRERAENDAFDLYDSIVSILAAAGPSYRFESAIGSDDLSFGGGQCYRIERRGVRLARAQYAAPGFQGQRHPGKAALLPSPLTGKAGSIAEPCTHGALVLDGLATRGRVTLRLSIEPLCLDDAQVLDLAILRRALEEGKADTPQDGAETQFPVATPDDLRAHEALLTQWIATRCGYRVRCTVSADRALPRHLLEIMGSELFRGVPVDVITITAKGKSLALVQPSPGETPGLDLRDAYVTGYATIALIPDPVLLQASGVPNAYPDVPRLLPETGLLLGYGKRGSDAPPVRLPAASRDRHCYVIGATGTGKSSLLFNMIQQDLRDGSGLCLIDPHGDLYEQVLDVIPSHRVQDVVAVDLADTEYSVGLNFLECTSNRPAMEMNYLVNEMMAIFNRLYNMAVAGGPAFEQYMRNAMTLVMDRPGEPATLLDVVRIFVDDAFRKKAKVECRNPLVVSFWNNIAERSSGEHDLSNFAFYITSKLNRFTHNAVLRPIIGQRRSTLDFRKFMDEGNVVIVNLAKGILGEFDSRLMGMLLLGRLFGAALGRADQPSNKRRHFHVYVDEFQSMVTSTVARMVSEARKYGLSVTMANQNTAQLAVGDFEDLNVLEAILGNVATLLMFRVGPTDAKVLESYALPTLDRLALQRLPDRHVLCRMLDSGKPLEPFVFQTALASMDGNDELARERIQQLYRLRYARKTAEVEQQIREEWSS